MIRPSPFLSKVWKTRFSSEGSVFLVGAEDGEGDGNMDEFLWGVLSNQERGKRLRSFFGTKERRKEFKRL